MIDGHATSRFDAVISLPHVYVIAPPLSHFRAAADTPIIAACAAFEFQMAPSSPHR